MIGLERAMLGICLLGNAQANAELLKLGDDDFDLPKHKTIAAVIRAMVRDERSVIDPITVAAELRARSLMCMLGPGPDGPLYLHQLAAEAPPAVSADYYAVLLRQVARLRMARHEVERTARILTGDEDSQEYLDEYLARHRERLDAIPGALTDPDPDADTVTRLMNEPENPADWLVPGLFERGERIVITGGEGYGKSTLLRQLAVTTSGGIHPWTGEPLPRPLKVLHIDAEYSRRQDRRGYQRTVMPGLVPGWSDRIRIYISPAGLDLPGRDAGWFHQVANDLCPDLIIVGPAYKLMVGDPQRDMDVQRLLSVLDEVRVRHDAAIVVEQHSPKGQDGTTRTVKPYGSQRWLAWPEIGFGMARDESVPEQEHRTEHPHYVELRRWRPPREPRDWPTNITWGPAFGLPWVPHGFYQPTVTTADLENVS